MLWGTINIAIFLEKVEISESWEIFMEDVWGNLLNGEKLLLDPQETCTLKSEREWESTFYGEKKKTTGQV